MLDSPKVEFYDEIDSQSQSENVSDSHQYFPHRHKLPEKQTTRLLEKPELQGQDWQPFSGLHIDLSPKHKPTSVLN